MKVLTLNTHSYMEENLEKQIEVLALAIKANDYQLVALQEVNQRKNSSKTKPDNYFQPVKKQKAIREDNFMLLLVNRLREMDCNYYWSWVYNHIGYDIYHEGVGLLSKSPLTSNSLLVSESADPADYRTRNVLISKTQFQGKDFVAVNGHFSWWISPEKGFSYEWQLLEKELEKFPSLPLMLMGDFNNSDVVANQGYQLVMESPLNLTDSYKQAEVRHGRGTVEQAIDGWQDNHESIRIDYIFNQPAFYAKTYKTIFDGKDRPQISDHLGIEVDFNWS